MSRMDCCVCLDACFGRPPPPTGPPPMASCQRTLLSDAAAAAALNQQAQARLFLLQLKLHRTTPNSENGQRHMSHIHTHIPYMHDRYPQQDQLLKLVNAHTHTTPSKTKPNSPNSLFLEFSHKDLREMMMMMMTMQPSRRVYPKRHTCPKRLNITARYKQILPSCQASIRNKKRPECT